MPLLSISAPATATWRLMEIARPGQPPEPLGILLVDPITDRLHLRMREAHEFSELDEPEEDFLQALPSDLEARGREMGGRAVMEMVEEFSFFLRSADRSEITCIGSASRTADRLFETHVDSRIAPYRTHVPLYALRAAATKFGESTETDSDSHSEWLRVRPGTRLEPGMFAAQVVGRSMEPLIPDGSLCLFRAPVTGSRQGRRLLIEQFDETDFAARYTVKKYTSRKRTSRDGNSGDNWEHEQIRLEPLNREFEAFDLAPDRFRVIAEFVEVLDA